MLSRAILLLTLMNIFTATASGTAYVRPKPVEITEVKSAADPGRTSSTHGTKSICANFS